MSSSLSDLWLQKKFDTLAFALLLLTVSVFVQVESPCRVRAVKAALILLTHIFTAVTHISAFLMLSLELGGNIKRGALLHFPKTEVVILQYPKFHLQCKINNTISLNLLKFSWTKCSHLIEVPCNINVSSTSCVLFN